MKTIILYGLRRSGNHFITSTILQCLNDPVYIHNCLEFSFDNYNKNRAIQMTVNRSERVFTGFKNANSVIITMEDKTIDLAELEKFKAIEDCHVILLLRNPYNNLASAWKQYMLNNEPDKLKPEIFNKIYSLWIDYANHYLNNDMINILYDRYVESEKYRNSIFNSIGVTSEEIDLEKKIKCQCSSYSNRSNQRKIWGSLEDSVYADDPEFVKLFETREHEKLWLEILK